MTWTFFARRIKANPTHYGADGESSIEQTLLGVVRTALDKLLEHDCIERVDPDDEDSDVQSTTLGIASSSYYLDYKTAKQMLFGVRQARKLITSTLEGNNEKEPASKSHPFIRSTQVDEISIAWMLYSICSTHEFDELPVRHNEEFLNQELSEKLIWGPDTASVLSSGDNAYQSPEIYEDPHTKAFLLVQAYLQKASLPISDYVNDTKTVFDNLPRLLAAMQFIACYREITAAASFELLTQLIRTRQCLESKLLPTGNPLVQLTGISHSSGGLIERIGSLGQLQKTEPFLLLSTLRQMDRGVISGVLQKLTKGKHRLTSSVDATLQSLYALPLVSIKSAKVCLQANKKTGKITVEVSFDQKSASRNARKNGDGDKLVEAISCSGTILLGTQHQRIFLGKAIAPFHRRGGVSSISRDVTFDWDIAKSDGDHIIVRVLLESVRGLDVEQAVPLFES